MAAHFLPDASVAAVTRKLETLDVAFTPRSTGGMSQPTDIYAASQGMCIPPKAAAPAYSSERGSPERASRSSILSHVSGLSDRSGPSGTGDGGLPGLSVGLPFFSQLKLSDVGDTGDSPEGDLVGAGGNLTGRSTGEERDASGLLPAAASTFIAGGSHHSGRSHASPSAESNLSPSIYASAGAAFDVTRGHAPAPGHMAGSPPTGLPPLYPTSYPPARNTVASTGSTGPGSARDGASMLATIAEDPANPASSRTQHRDYRPRAPTASSTGAASASGPQSAASRPGAADPAYVVDSSRASQADTYRSGDASTARFSGNEMTTFARYDQDAAAAAAAASYTAAAHAAEMTAVVSASSHEYDSHGHAGVHGSQSYHLSHGGGGYAPPPPGGRGGYGRSPGPPPPSHGGYAHDPYAAGPPSQHVMYGGEGAPEYGGHAMSRPGAAPLLHPEDASKDMSTMRCRSCGDFGHMMRYCPRVVCFTCHCMGHMASVCPYVNAPPPQSHMMAHSGQQHHSGYGGYASHIPAPPPPMYAPRARGPPAPPAMYSGGMPSYGAPAGMSPYAGAPGMMAHMYMPDYGGMAGYGAPMMLQAPMPDGSEGGMPPAGGMWGDDAAARMMGAPGMPYMLTPGPGMMGGGAGMPPGAPFPRGGPRPFPR